MSNNTLKLEKMSLIPMIAELHARRIGWVRVYSGGLSMYLSIPFWVLMHTFSSAICYFGFIVPLLNLKKLEVGHYLVMKDRLLVKELFFVDRLNCEFCAYANGLTTLINAQIDQVATYRERKPVLTWVLLAPAFLVCLFVALVSEFVCIRLVYDQLIAGPLGLHTSRFGVIYYNLKNSDYAGRFHSPFREGILFVKTVFLRFEQLLEQIESSWCPIKHLKRELETQYPKHHVNFLEPHEVDRLRAILETEGTVSRRGPLY